MVLTFSWLVFALSLFTNEARHVDTNSMATTEMAKNENPITSHILDTTVGRPASGVKIALSKYDKATNQFTQISEQFTNEDGRVGNIITSEQFTPGVYKLYFDTKPYFDKMGTETFYPFVEIVFEVKNAEEHYHVPLLLNPFGYSTYRGS